MRVLITGRKGCTGTVMAPMLLQAGHTVVGLGTHIPIHPPEWIEETRSDYLIILPRNLKDEIMEQCEYIRSWGGQFVVAIPDVTVYP